MPGEADAAGVLVVDDDAVVLAFLEIVLGQLGVPVWPASSAAEAFALCRKFGGGIGLALLDVSMPGVNGPDLLRQLHGVCPGLRCFFLTGGPEYGEEVLLAAGAERVLHKPISPARLRQAVREALALPQVGP